MDEQKKTPEENPNPKSEVPANLSAEETPTGLQNKAPEKTLKDPLGKHPLDSQSKKGLLIASISTGVVLILMTTLLVIGYQEASKNTEDTGTAYNGTIISGFFDQNGHRIAAGGSFRFTYQTASKDSYFSLASIDVTSDAAKTIILPYYASSEESKNAAAYVLSTADGTSSANLFGTGGLQNVEAVYAERYFAEVGVYAFSHLTTLKTFAMANTSVENATTVFGDFAFAGDAALTKVSLPNSLTSLGDGVFQDCASLTTLTLPSKLASIGAHALSGATALTELRYLNTKDEFQKIQLGSDWKEATLTRVLCTDGILTLA